MPHKNGAVINNNISLGNNTYKFNNLVLGGTATVNQVSINGTTVIDSSRNLTNLESISLADSKKIKFGNSDDLEIYHNGSDSWIHENGTGNLNIKSNGTFINFLDSSNNLMAYMVPGGAVGLYHNTSAKLATTSGGVDVTGEILATSTITSNGKLVSTADGSEGGHLLLRANSGGAKQYSWDVDSSNNLRLIGEDDGTGNNGFIIMKSSSGADVDFQKDIKMVGTTVIDTSRNLTNINSLSVAGYIYHTGDTNTSIQFASDEIISNTGGSARFKVRNDGITAIATPVIITQPNSAEMKFFQTTSSTTATKGSIQWFDSGSKACGSIRVVANGSENNSGFMEFYVTSEADEITDPFGINKVMTIADDGVTVHGSLSKSSGSFKIDHPLKPDTHHLVHSFVEGPQADNLYRGTITLQDGRAVIDLDEWFGMTPGTFLALNRDIQAFVSNVDDWDAVKAKMMGSQLVIECQNAESKASVSWLVVGERQDKEIYESKLTDDNGKIIVEPSKEVVE